MAIYSLLPLKLIVLPLIVLPPPTEEGYRGYSFTLVLETNRLASPYTVNQPR